MHEQPPIRKILVPLDFSDDSTRAFDYAVALSRLGDAEVVLLTVVEDRFPYPELFAWDRPDEEFYRSMRERSLSRMGELEAARGGGITVEKVVVTGRPVDEIAEVARQLEVDLIVVARHGSSRVRSALMGSTTAGVIRTAPCGVLVLPAQVSVEHPHGEA